WPRSPTDLGRFYFQLIFTVATVVLYFATRQEWLLVVVLAIDLVIARQLIPFVRFDGYWALTDLLGIPDLFSQIRSTLRRAWKRRPIATGLHLKPWVRPV